jgi:hypothetical protein
MWAFVAHISCSKLEQNARLCRTSKLLHQEVSQFDAPMGICPQQMSITSRVLSRTCVVVRCRESGCGLDGVLSRASGVAYQAVSPGRQVGYEGQYNRGCVPRRGGLEGLGGYDQADEEEDGQDRHQRYDRQEEPQIFCFESLRFGAEGFFLPRG